MNYCSVQPFLPLNESLISALFPKGRGQEVKRELHLVAAKQSPEPSNSRLELGDYIADVLLDTRFNAKVCHWIVQKVGSPEIVSWGQEYTFQEAKTAAQTCLENLNQAQQKKNA